MDINLALKTLSDEYKDITEIKGIVLYLSSTKIDIDNGWLSNQVIRVNIESISINNAPYKYKDKERYKGYTGIYILIDKEITVSIQIENNEDILELINLYRVQIFIKDRRIKKDIVIFYNNEIYEIPIEYPNRIKMI